MKFFTNHLARIRNRLHSVHKNQSGSISIVSVFSIMFLAMVLGMIMNVGRHVDRKLIMQNGADAATFSGGASVARSLNTLVFTNHMMCEVFGITAYLREARDRNTEELVYPILDAWVEVAPQFATAPSFTGWQILASAIPGQAPLEENLVSVFSDMNAAVSEQLLPVMEEILDVELIPDFQRALVAAAPRLAGLAANEIANRHGPENGGLSGGWEMTAQMWRTDGTPFEVELEETLLPVADPIFDVTYRQPYYMRNGLRQREYLANHYLNRFNDYMLHDFHQAPLSYFSPIWRRITCWYLENLLAEYPNSNIPYQMRLSSISVQNDYLEWEFMYVGTTYWKNMTDQLPGLFVNPSDADQTAFAQVRIYIPRARLIYDPTEIDPEDQIYRESRFHSRNLLNQSWVVRMTPATCEAIPQILQTPVPYSNSIPPNLGGIGLDEFQRLNTH